MRSKLEPFHESLVALARAKGARAFAPLSVHCLWKHAARLLSEASQRPSSTLPLKLAPFRPQKQRSRRNPAPWQRPGCCGLRLVCANPMNETDAERFLGPEAQARYRNALGFRIAEPLIQRRPSLRYRLDPGLRLSRVWHWTRNSLSLAIGPFGPVWPARLWPLLALRFRPEGPGQ
jgi:hypothetical protein